MKQRPGRLANAEAPPRWNRRLTGAPAYEGGTTILPLQPTAQEVEARIHALWQRLCRRDDNWDAALILDKANQYYFTATVQDGLLLLRRNGEYAYFVRRSYPRACQEALISPLYPLQSYRDLLPFLGQDCQQLLVESEVMPYATLQRLRKYLPLQTIGSCDQEIRQTRAVKSAYELAWIQESARQHALVLDEIAPSLLHEGISEREFVAALMKEMLLLGFQGMARFALFQTEICCGQLGFGENSQAPTNFNGPGGMQGMAPAIPFAADPSRRLGKGDAVFLDIGYGVNGYHSDRTQVYCYGAEPPAAAVQAHQACLAIQKQAAAALRPGAIPAEIYRQVLSAQDPDFLDGFMGCDATPVKFLGHGVGLQVDELPVIAEGMHEPLEANMVIALEPKHTVPGYGMVGVEDTYLVTPAGGRCLTGGERDIRIIPC